MQTQNRIKQILPTHEFHSKHAVWSMTQRMYSEMEKLHIEQHGYGIGGSTIPATSDWLDFLECVKQDIANEGRSGAPFFPVWFFAEVECSGKRTNGMIAYDEKRNVILVTR